MSNYKNNNESTSLTSEVMSHVQIASETLSEVYKI